MTLLLHGVPANAGESAPDEPAVVSRVTIVEIVPPGGMVRVGLEAIPAQPGRSLKMGDIVETGANAWVQVLVSPATVVWLAPLGRLGVRSNLDGAKPVVLTLYRGQARFIAPEGLEELERVTVQAGNGVAELQGAGFVVRVARTGAVSAGVLDGALVFRRPVDGGRRFRVDPGHLLSLDPSATWIRTEPRGRRQMEAGTVPAMSIRGFGAAFVTPLIGRDGTRTPDSRFQEEAFAPVDALDPSLAVDRGPWTVTLE